MVAACEIADFCSRSRAGIGSAAVIASDQLNGLGLDHPVFHFSVARHAGPISVRYQHQASQVGAPEDQQQ
jgi:hypothetical protein